MDKITTVRRAKLGERIGELDDADIVRLNRAVVTTVVAPGEVVTAGADEEPAYALVIDIVGNDPDRIVHLDILPGITQPPNAAASPAPTDISKQSVRGLLMMKCC